MNALEPAHIKPDGVFSINPATGLRLDFYPYQTDAAIEATLDAAAAAFRRARVRPVADRLALLARVADTLAARRLEFATLIVAEMGKPLTEALGEIDKCVDSCRHFAVAGAGYLEPDLLAITPQRARISYEPLGVIFAIMPWNFPIWQFVRFFITAVAAGNATILKHAENVQGSAALLTGLVETAGGDGVLQNLLVPRDQVAAMIADDRIAGVTFTGSVGAGREVAGAAGAAGKKSVLELGGSDPFIVLEDADLDHAVEIAVKSRFANTGQSCICAKRFIVVDSVHDAFIEAFCAKAAALVVGDPMLAGTQIGALARSDLRDGLVRQVDRSLAEGARMILTGGTTDGAGFFYTPVVLANLVDGSTAATEEIFGPVAAMFRAKDADDAIAQANRSRFGLGASIWTKDIARAERLIPGIEAGAVFVNDLVRSVAGAPFGGIKDSGYGRELGQLGTREFTNQKLVWINE